MSIIRKLEWKDHDQISVSVTPFGEYVVRRHSEKLWSVSTTPNNFGLVNKFFDTAEKAKQAAQEQFEDVVGWVLVVEN